MTPLVIDAVRRSLGRTDQTPLSPRPAIYPPRLPESTEAEIRLFLDEVKKLSGVGQMISASEIEAALKTMVAEQRILKATMWNTPLLKNLKIAEQLNALGVQLISPNSDKDEIARCDLGITESDFILPETGTLILRSSTEKPRSVSLVPRIHLAIVNSEMLRADMHQVFTEAKDNPYLVFITGPSRTADIELTVTLGVHGPKNLYIWMLEQ